MHQGAKIADTRFSPSSTCKLTRSLKADYYPNSAQIIEFPLACGSYRGDGEDWRCLECRRHFYRKAESVDAGNPCKRLVPEAHQPSLSALSIRLAKKGLKIQNRCNSKLVDWKEVEEGSQASRGRGHDLRISFLLAHRICRYPTS